jgi:hypothetical protein
MDDHTDIELHFDVMSCRALLSCEGRDYVLPDTYPTREAARAAAQKFAWDKLGLHSRRGGKPSDLAIWLR